MAGAWAAREVLHRRTGDCRNILRGLYVEVTMGSRVRIVLVAAAITDVSRSVHGDISVP